MMRMTPLAAAAFASLLLGCAVPAGAAIDAHGNVDPAAGTDTSSPAAQLFAARCASCHDHPQGRTPPRAALRYRPPDAVEHALVAGPMRPMAAGLGDEEIRSLVVYLTGRKPGPRVDPLANRCASPGRPPVLAADDWSSTHGNAANSRFRAGAGIDADAVPRLALKWAFAYPGGASGPVTLAGERVFLAASSYVIALDAATGCAHWAHAAGGRIVRAVTLAELPARGPEPARTVALFGDDASTVTALDATDGTPLWRTRVEEHVLSRITAAPSVHAGRVFVPLSSIEDPLTHDENYACCTSRGGVAALDLASGALLWKQHHIGEEPRLQSDPQAATPRYGPAGASTYTPLAIDARRGLLYATTAEEYGFLDAAGPYSVIAYDLASGERRWARQFLPQGEARRAACATAPTLDCRNVFSMGTSVLIHTLADGRQLLLAGQKWGMVYALDPDHEGALLWQSRVAQGGDLGGIMYGLASDGSAVYVPVSDDEAKPPHRPGGLAALDPVDGSVLWRVVGAQPRCSWGREACSAAVVAAPTAVPGAVFTGAWDGQLRIHASADGRLLRAIDTGKRFAAVNGGEAQGGQVSGYPVVIGRNAVYVTSGASSVLRPGNALLVFTPDGK